MTNEATNSDVGNLIASIKSSREEDSIPILLGHQFDQLIAALEQAQQEYQTIEQKLISAAVYIETLESEPRKTNLKLLNEIAGLKRKCEELETASIKPVNMPDAYAIRPGHPINEDERSVMIPKDGGNWFSRLDIEHALRVAGVKFEGGE